MTEPHSTSELAGVTATMLIPLWARAVEAARRDPILRDPKAVEMVARLDYDFSAFERSTKLTQMAACVLAKVLDGWVRRFLAQHPAGTIVELGVGLDTRFERLDNGQAHWFEVDLPAVMALRRRFFSEQERRRFVAASFLDAQWLDQVAASPGPYLFVAEAVLMYLSEAEVRELFGRLADRFPGCLVAFDACGTLVQRSSKKLEAVRLTGAEFRWGINDVGEIEGWDPNFKRLEEDCVLNHHRDRFPWPVRLATWLFPQWRRVFTINLVRLGSASL